MEEKLRQLGDDTSIRKIQPVSGGDINQAYYVATEKQDYFIKANRKVSSNFFQIEADGLERIRATQTIAVPDVYYYDQKTTDEDMVLIMEWIDGEKTTATSQQLGEQLAAMHLAKNTAQYGYNQPTFVGELTQLNQWYDNWVDYYREKRLLPQMELAIQQNRMPQARRSRLTSLIEHLEKYLPSKPRTSLLHGDLWGGNWLTGPHGRPYIIDPSVVYGDHLFELSFTELFGGFPADFYHHYQDIFPLADYYQEVKPLYQLFYLLVHLNIFGEGYGASVDRILKHYVDK
ncbi:fructosamine kinase family protein [Gracilibacillus phocaeensis]|uniref:fructosamine kinase family protein n=1 Tax=Gracilibacillus phocaeensis TaxID=2042304 RepID=UPI0010323932|nr:fructosamine kinase family protein [Gracilibacillus phocaeensis]